MTTHVEALERAVRIAGSQKKLAEAIAAFIGRPSFRQQTVSYWVRNGTLIGPEYWAAIEHATQGAAEGAVTRADLRPDVFTQAA